MAGFGSRTMGTVQEPEAERRYRSAIPLTGGLVGSFAFFLLGIAMLINGVETAIGETVVGGFVVAIAGMVAGLVATAFAELTPTGLAYRRGRL
jgi:hypothetical protein